MRIPLYQNENKSIQPRSHEGRPFGGLTALRVEGEASRKEELKIFSSDLRDLRAFAFNPPL